MSVAAPREVPPRVKKSTSGLVTAVPRESDHNPASHSWVGVSNRASPREGSGHGRAFLSTLPEVVTGRESSGHSRGTIAAGKLFFSSAWACARSNSSALPASGET